MVLRCIHTFVAFALEGSNMCVWDVFVVWVWYIFITPPANTVLILACSHRESLREWERCQHGPSYLKYDRQYVFVSVNVVALRSVFVLLIIISRHN